MSISKYGSNAMTGSHPSKVPDGAGDAYYEQDRMRDFAWLWEKAGDIGADISGGKFILLGGGVKIGSGSNTFVVDAGVGFVPYNVPLGTDASTPPATADETIRTVRVEWPTQTDIGSVSGTTTYYVKVKYAETNGFSRTRLKAGGSWDATKVPSYTFVIDTSAPATDELLLGTATVSAGVITDIVQQPMGAASPYERYTPRLGYTPSVGDIVELESNGRIRQFRRNAISGNVYAGAVDWMKVAKLDSDRMVVIYHIPATRYEAVVATYDHVANTFSYGTPVAVIAQATVGGADIVELGTNSNKVGFAYSPILGQLSVVIISVSGTTITVNSPVNGAATATVYAIAKWSDSAFVMMWTTNGTTNLTGAWVTISGTTPTIAGSSAITLGVTCYLSKGGVASIDLAGGFVLTAVTEVASPRRVYFCSWTSSGSTLANPSSGAIGWGGVSKPCAGHLMGNQDSVIVAPSAKDAAVTFVTKVSLYWVRRSGNAILGDGALTEIADCAVNYADFATSKIVDDETFLLNYGGVDSTTTSVFSRWQIVTRSWGPAPSYVFSKETQYVSAAGTAPLTAQGGVTVLNDGTIIAVFALDTATYNRLIAISRTNKIFGIAVDSYGTIQRYGVYTQAVGLTVGKPCYVTDTGTIGQSKNDGEIGVALTSTKVLLNIRPGV